MKPIALLSGALLVAAVLASLPAHAQQASEGDGIPPSELPATDSPESSASVRALRPQWQGGRKKVQTFLVPLDEKARAPTARVAQALEQLQGSLAQYEVVDLGRALKADAAPEQATKAAEGRRLLAEGNLLLAGRGYDDAAGKYKAAIGALEKGLPALEAREYAEAWARLGAAQALSGDDKASRVAFINAARHDPESKLQARSIDTSADNRLAGGRADVEALPAGVLEVESRPGGARVLVDGEAKGSTPMRLELQSGKHLVRVERAGYFPSAELVDVPAGREFVHTAALKSTPRAADLYETMASAAEEAGRGEVAGNSSRLAEKFGLERLFIGSVASHGSKVTLMLALIDLPKHRQVAKIELLLAADGTDADQLEEETRQAGRKLAMQDGGDAVAQAQGQATVPAQTSGPGPARGPASPATSPTAAAAPPSAAGGSRTSAIPVDELDLATKEKRPAPAADPATTTAATPAEPERTTVVKPGEKPRKKPKKLKEKTGQEGWNDD